MSRKELIGKLTPGYFEQGENFDKEVFALLITTLQKQVSNVWVQLVIVAAMFGFGYLIMAAIGGAIGNGLMVVFIFLGLILGGLSTMGTSRQIKSACRILGITMKDVNAAIRRVRDEYQLPVIEKTEVVEAEVVVAEAKTIIQRKRKTPVWLYAASILAALVYLFLLVLGIGVMNDRNDEVPHGITISVSSLIGLTAAVLAFKKKRYGVFIAFIPVIAFLTGSLLSRGVYQADYLIITSIAATPLILLLTLLPVIKKASNTSGQEAEEVVRQIAHRSTTENVTPITSNKKDISYPTGKYAIPFLLATLAQLTLFFLPWLTLSNDVHQYTIPDILELADWMRFSGSLFSMPYFFLWVAITVMGFTIVLQLIEFILALTGRLAPSIVVKFASICAIVECAAVTLMFVMFWTNLFFGFYPTPWLITILAALACQLVLARKLKKEIAVTESKNYY